ncbi:MAG: indolepyruvate oxidoreductase subunit beta family protein [Casimicrobiaceae bacterium]
MGNDARALRVLVAALGGQGGGVLAEWLVDAATAAGLFAQSTSIPGVAQRTGATTYYIEVFPIAIDALGGRRPVLGLYPVPGAIDLVVASELLEAGRVLQAGMVSADCTHLVTSTSRTLTTAEKMSLGDGRFSSDRLVEVARTHSRRLTAFDMDATAREAGTVVSAVMLGAIAGSGILPIGPAVFEGVIRNSGVGVEGSLRGFAAGVAAVREEALDAAGGLPDAPASAAGTGVAVPDATADPMPAGTDGMAWPATVAAMAALGEARLSEYQDRRYAGLYRERVAEVLAAERRADPEARHDHALTREYARFLALWMAFDDIVRVAGLKVRASRFARVHHEVGAAPGDVVRIVDHFKPGIPELAGLLPPRLAAGLVRWEGRRQTKGRTPLAFALHLRSDGVLGLALLRMLASLRAWRRRGARYADEQAGIARWHDAVLRAAAVDWDLAHELALCGRLVKGYGETNLRGKRNLSHIMTHLATTDAPAPMRAVAVREARDAALADEGGLALDATLARLGAPPRPVTVHPIRFVRKPSNKPAATTSA